MIKKTLSLAETEKQYLEQLVSGPHLGTHLRKAQIILDYDQGLSTAQIATQMGISPRGVRYWREAFERIGMAVFPDYTLPQKPPVIDQAKPITRPVIKHQRLLPADLLAEAGRKVMSRYFSEMLSCEAGTRLGEDIEQLHDMRVASRRLRAAMNIFGEYFIEKEIRSFRKDLRAAGRVLGQVRDLDVFMAQVHAYLQSLPEDEQAGLSPLLAQWESKRQAARSLMLAHLDSPRYQAFVQEYAAFLEQPGAGVKPVEKADQPVADVLRVSVPVLIYSSLATVRAYENCLEKASIEQLHALRTDFKRFRYTIEFFRDVLGSEAKLVIEDLKAIQDHLGELHDADVACTILNDYLHTWEMHESTLPLTGRHSPEPILAYLASRHADRHQYLVTFPETWSHFNRPEFRKNLALAVAAV